MAYNLAMPFAFKKFVFVASIALTLQSVCTEPGFGARAPEGAVEAGGLAKAKSAENKPVSEEGGGTSVTGHFHGGIINGKGHLYTLDAPGGWRADAATGSSIGIPVMFIPVDAVGPDYPTIIYSQMLETRGQPSEKIIEQMVRMLKPQGEMGPDYVQPSLVLKSGREVLVRKLPPARDGHHQLLAFIAEKDWMVVVIQASDTAELLERNKPIFEKIVGSYVFE